MKRGAYVDQDDINVGVRTQDGHDIIQMIVFTANHNDVVSLTLPVLKERGFSVLARSSTRPLRIH